MSDYLEQLISVQKSAEQGNLDQALKDCEEILASWPDNAEALHLCGYILILRGQLGDAVRRLTEAISEQPDNYVYHSTLAVAYQSAGNIPAAAASYRRVLNLRPDDQDALVALAEICAEKGIDAAELQAAKEASSKLMGYLFAKSFEYSARANAVGGEHPGAEEMGRLLDSHVQRVYTNELNSCVPAHIGRGKPKVIYPLRVTARIGHLIAEPFLLKCLFDPNEYDIVILTPPRETAVSVPVYDVALRDTFPVELEGDRQGLKIWGARCGIHTIGDTTYVIENINDLGGRVLRKAINGELPYRLYLTDDEQQQGQQLRQKMGIPADAPIVTLYVREKGYLPSMTYHGIRNASIENYIPAIKHLVDQGFYVVRLGDDKMHPLPDLGPQVIDAPFHPAYSQLVEPYFVSQSTFMLKTISGPDFLSMAFGVPCLMTNFYWQPFVALIKGDICIPKKYYSHRYQRELTLSEIAMDRKLYFSIDTNDFTARHVELLENTDAEILAATREMVSRLGGDFQENDAYQTRFRNLCQRIHADSENDIFNDTHDALDADYFGAYLSGAKISDAFCDLNPEFLW